MNDLANRLLSEMLGLKSYFLGKEVDGSYCEFEVIDRKMFFVFENTKSGK